MTEREIKMLFQTIRLLKQEGVAILYISHRLEEIFQIADSVTILRDGQHIISGDIQEFTMDSVILNMVGHSLSEQLEQLQQNRKDFSGGEVTISVEGLSKRKFQNISFSARKGEIFGISGLVGAGRTELLEAIYGFAPADSGAVKINGNVVQMKNCSAALKRGLALIPEERQRKGLFLQQSVQYNINIAVLKKYKEISAASRQANGSGCS
ncbi:MAG: ATP-binding cassette domain-containing protein [Oscillospiraceae bacterium]